MNLEVDSRLTKGLDPHRLAFGVGLRRCHFQEAFERPEEIDFLEILPENFMDFGGRSREVLRRANERWPIISHGVSLNIGGPDPLDQVYLRRLTEFFEELQPAWFSDHLSYSAAFGVQYHDLLPLPFTEEAIKHVVARIRQVQEVIRRPFLLENPSYYILMPGAEMSEAEFMVEVLERADCGLLLDVNNLFVNASNHNYDAYAFIDMMPASRVMQYHMAGHDDSGPFLLDTHGDHINDSVFKLYEYTLRALGPAWTLLEWDNEIPTWETLQAENRAIRGVAERALGGS